MRDSRASRMLAAAAAVVTAIAAVIALQQWLAYSPAVDLSASLPGRDGRPEGASSAGFATDLSGTHQEFGGVPADLPGFWPRFRGPDFDNICKEEYALTDSFDDGGPKLLWSVELGEGHAAPAVLNGRVYLLDYDESARADAVRCFSLADGQEIWRHSYPVTIKRNHGFSRTVPAVTDDFIVTIGPRCHVVCLDAKSGAFRWGISMQDAYGTTEPLWYTGQCPLIDNGLAILAPAGPEVLIAALRCETGETVWQTPNPRGWNMSHSSIVPMTFEGTRMFVYCAIGGAVGIVADGPDAGRLLWELPWDANVVAPSPVPLDDGKVLFTAGYGNGSLMAQLRRQGDGFAAEVLYDRGPAEWLACEQQTPIYYDGLLHAIMPKDAGALRGQFVCYDPQGSLVWSSGQANRFGLGPYILADGKFYILSDDGVLTVIQQSREQYIPLGQARVLDGQDAWGPIAIAGTRMLLRDSTRMICIEAGAAHQEHVNQ
ncbi:MAG TPA: PQQ-binding-like beta-propeller repeat protein [Candidatus Hydrogenedentes bacterium]|nr:PQQ-binding-like beta-propeller repeat protein [Candidatus Hydrogenedentota bacterium]HQE82631.1 PQQ-binding-like beta-propeller repeat protein [Candidatus Hydrogenedentota bacterium]HQH67360.1 PQQ-binding-like beta-propeller repeat protein [Candidatus Hydrogenedentota bacterium]HQM48410.1 PQQ-binding-like beta-propeller repeat protein [Candidatus Hydrogenedentota bacterium]